MATAGGGGGAGGGPTSARAVATNGGQAHLEALYWERANELWKEPARIGWLQQVASSLLNELIAAVAARPDGGGTGGGKGGGHGEGGGVLTEFRELASRRGGLPSWRRQSVPWSRVHDAPSGAGGHSGGGAARRGVGSSSRHGTAALAARR